MKGAFIVHMSLDEWLAHANETNVGDETIWLKSVMRPDYEGYSLISMGGWLVGTYADAGYNIHSLAIHVQRVDMIVEQQRNRAALWRNLEVAREIATRAILVRVPMANIQEGIQLVPGLDDVLYKYSANPTGLWRFQKRTTSDTLPILVADGEPQ